LRVVCVLGQKKWRITPACGFHACRPVIPADAGPAFQGMPGRI
jgi:hypothetical protein